MGNDAEGMKDNETNPDELIVIPLARIIEDVQACVDANISVAGLALALTIPDILGATCYPELVYDNGERRVRSQYRSWFDSWVAKRFVDRLNWFNGDMCYELRCSFLHSGRSDIEYRHRESDGLRYHYTFRLVDDGEQVHRESDDLVSGVRNCFVAVNADVLASAICEAAAECIGQMPQID